MMFVSDSDREPRGILAMPIELLSVNKDFHFIETTMISYFLLRIKGYNTDNRAEDLLCHQSRAVTDVGYNSGPHEVTLKYPKTQILKCATYAWKVKLK